MSPEEDERFYRDTESIAFPKLDDHQLSLLEPLGVRRKIRNGEVIVKAGQREFPMALVVSGELEVYESRDGVEQILSTPGPRNFVGEVSMLTGTSAIANVRGKAEESEILLIPAAELKRALADLPAGRYRLVITRPDGSESIEEVDQPTELIERSVQLMNTLRGDGWHVS